MVGLVGEKERLGDVWPQLTIILCTYLMIMLVIIVHRTPKDYGRFNIKFGHSLETFT